MNPPGTPSIAFAGTLSLEEFGRVQKALLPAWTRWSVLAPVLAAALFAASGAATDPISLLFDVGVTASTPIALGVVSRRFRKRAWQRSAQIVGRVRGAISPDAIDWVTDRSTSRGEWARIVEVRHADDLALPFYAPRCAFYFPRSFFDSDAAWTASTRPSTATPRSEPQR
jgi:hypothetical protein